MTSLYSKTARVCSFQWQRCKSTQGTLYHPKSLPLYTCRGFGKYAKYEKQAHARMRIDKHFYGWKKYIVIAYNLGFFKLLKWGLIGYVVHKYWWLFRPILKWGAILTAGTFVGLFWLRFGIYRQFGAAKSEQLTKRLKFGSTRFERVFQEYDQLATLPLSYLCAKSFLKCCLFRNHRPWLRSLQSFLDGYKPFQYYTGEMKHGIAFQPLLIEHEGHFNGHFTWFIDRKDTMNTFGWVEVKCEGNLSAKTMNVREFRLHVNPREGGEVLKFNPFRLSIDDAWKAEFLEELHDFGVDKDVGEQKANKNVLREKLHRKRKAKHANISEAEYKIK